MALMAQPWVLFALLFSYFFSILPTYAGNVSGSLQKWDDVTVDFSGPSHSESDSNPNPFLDYRLQVIFSAPISGKTYSVPGYFDGDGVGGGTGSVWRVKFTPDEVGEWTYEASLRAGTNISVELDPLAGSPVLIDGAFGKFAVTATDAAASGFYKHGRLESVNHHYLRFRSGDYWLKLGANSPENLLGYDGFDNTPFAWHSFANHEIDWQPGDPDWDSPDRAGTTDGRGLIGALNYLNQQQLNSIYFMPMNIGADGMDTWPFSDPGIDRTGSPLNDNVHYDVSKLYQWQIALEHAQRKEIFLHFVLSDNEREHREELDLAELGIERKLFYREMVARFAHHNALQWNISEEYNSEIQFTPETIKEFANYIFAVDPYRHPITVHSTGTTYKEALAPFLSDAWFRILSVQVWQQAEDIGGAIEYFRNETALLGKPLPVMLDESIGMNQITAEEHRKRTHWDALLSGGGFEMFKSFGDSELDDFRVYEEYYRYARYARRFVEDNLPYWEMVPSDELVAGENPIYGGAEVFAKIGDVYAIYLPSASPAPVLTLDGSNTTFEQRWYNPRTGNFEGPVVTYAGTAPVSLGLPPADVTEDWTVLVTALPQGNSPPIAADQQISTAQDATIPVSLEFDDPDGPGPYTYEVTVPPTSGSLSAISAGGTTVYTPNTGFTGVDSFTWRVNDGLDDSAEVNVVVAVIGQEQAGIYFPPLGESTANQNLKSPPEVGLSSSIMADLSSVITVGRWALWRHGYLVGVVGDFNANTDVRSVRKTIHAATVGAAIQRGLVPSLEHPDYGIR
jgi:hypothetical protein